MKKDTLAALIQEGSRFLSEVMRTHPRQRPSSHQPASPPQAQKGGSLTTEETVQYQRREIGKELLLLEKHLQQGCKIDSKACDCCFKHPVAIEALAQEALGMSADPAFSEVIKWTRQIAPKTTQAASASGEHDKEYPRLAIRARELRKSLMGTESTSALLATEVHDADKVSATEKPD
ncbi:MAG: hypothetical protein Q8P12_01065 [bacterium]|nr:hypothetical protein [bacterium]